MTEVGATGDDYKMACLNSAMSDEALDLVDSLPYENNGDENDIGNVLDLLKKHYVGATNEINESYKFFQRSHEDGEPVTDYIAAGLKPAGATSRPLTLGEMQRHVYIRIPVRALINLTGKGVKSMEIERRHPESVRSRAEI